VLCKSFRGKRVGASLLPPVWVGTSRRCTSFTWSSKRIRSQTEIRLPPYEWWHCGFDELHVDRRDRNATQHNAGSSGSRCDWDDKCSVRSYGGFAVGDCW